MVTLILYQNPHLKIKMKIVDQKGSEKYSSKETCFILVNSTFPKFILLWHHDPAFFLLREATLLVPNQCFQSRKVKEMRSVEDLVWHTGQQWKVRLGKWIEPRPRGLRGPELQLVLDDQSD